MGQEAQELRNGLNHPQTLFKVWENLIQKLQSERDVENRKAFEAKREYDTLSSECMSAERTRDTESATSVVDSILFNDLSSTVGANSVQSNTSLQTMQRISFASLVSKTHTDQVVHTGDVTKSQSKIGDGKITQRLVDKLLVTTPNLPQESMSFSRPGSPTAVTRTEEQSARGRPSRHHPSPRSPAPTLSRSMSPVQGQGPSLRSSKLDISSSKRMQSLSPSPRPVIRAAGDVLSQTAAGYPAQVQPSTGEPCLLPVTQNPRTSLPPVVQASVISPLLATVQSINYRPQSNPLAFGRVTAGPAVPAQGWRSKVNANGKISRLQSRSPNRSTGGELQSHFPTEMHRATIGNPTNINVASPPPGSLATTPNSVPNGHNSSMVTSMPTSIATPLLESQLVPPPGSRSAPPPPQTPLQLQSPGGLRVPMSRSARHSPSLRKSLPVLGNRQGSTDVIMRQSHSPSPARPFGPVAAASVKEVDTRVALRAQ